MALPVLLRPSTLGLIVVLFVVAFVTDASSKRILHAHPQLSLTLTLAQFAVSAAAGWMLLRLTRGGVAPLPSSWRACAPVLHVTLAQSAGTLATNVALGAMDVGFVATVKSSEALFTAALARLVQGARFSVPVYFSLLPIVCGVILSAKTEASFTWIGLTAALVSNACFATRAVLLAKQTTLQRRREAELQQRIDDAAQTSKSNGSEGTGSISEIADDPQLRNRVSSTNAAPKLQASSQQALLQRDPNVLHLDDVSNFTYVCFFSALLLLPLVVLKEGGALVALVGSDGGAAIAGALAVQLFLTGLGQWMYTLASLLLLARTSPLVHVVLHALRRVYVVCLATLLREGTLFTLSRQSVAGTALVIAGATWFAIEKGRQQPHGKQQVTPVASGTATKQGAAGIAATKKEQ
jgi:hypothetical protein